MKAGLLVSNLVAGCNAYAQQADSLYIKTYENKFLVKASLNNTTEVFEVYSNPLKYSLAPNTKFKLKIHFNYRFVSFAFGFSPRFIPGNDEDDRKGKSQSFNLQLNLVFRHWIQFLSYNQIKGFYLINTGDFVNDGWDANQDKFIQFPDLYYQGLSGYTAYSTNKNYSVNALSTQTEHQLKSAGSFIPLIAYRYYIMDDRTPLNGQNSSQKSNNFELTAQLGYSHTFVMARKRVFVSPLIAAGGGYIYTRLLSRLPDGDFTSHQSNPILRLAAQFSAGYNSKTFFAGLSFAGNFETYLQEGSGTRILNEQVSAQVFLGYRFLAPKFMRKAVEMVPIPKL